MIPPLVRETFPGVAPCPTCETTDHVEFSPGVAPYWQITCSNCHGDEYDPCANGLTADGAVDDWERVYWENAEDVEEAS